jgi:hypothetical protein
MQLVGPHDDDYVMSDSFNTSTSYTSACGQTQTLYISSLLDIVPASSSSVNKLTIDSENFAFTQVFGMAATPC